jgi:hypothetical protein
MGGGGRRGARVSRGSEVLEIRRREGSRTRRGWGKRWRKGVTLTRSACLPEEDDKGGSIEGGLRCDFGLEEGG